MFFLLLERGHTDTDTGSNPTEAGHCVTTMGKLFTPTVPIVGQKAGLTS